MFLDLQMNLVRQRGPVINEFTYHVTVCIEALDASRVYHIAAQLEGECWCKTKIFPSKHALERSREFQASNLK